MVKVFAGVVAATLLLAGQAMAAPTAIKFQIKYVGITLDCAMTVTSQAKNVIAGYSDNCKFLGSGTVEKQDHSAVIGGGSAYLPWPILLVLDYPFVSGGHYNVYFPLTQSQNGQTIPQSKKLYSGHYTVQ